MNNDEEKIINACKKITKNPNIFNESNKNVEDMIKTTIEKIFLEEIKDPEIKTIRKAFAEIKENKGKLYNCSYKDYDELETKAALATLSIENNQLLEIYKKYL